MPLSHRLCHGTSFTQPLSKQHPILALLESKMYCRQLFFLSTLRAALIPCIAVLQPTRGQWQKVFYISAIICVVGAVIFVVFGSGEVQPWNDGDPVEEVEIEQESRKPDSIARHYRQNESINCTT